jgi:hypothetical protein
MTHNLDLMNNKYSEKELEENVNSFNINDWYFISCCQKLSEEFIEKHLDQVYWHLISEYQTLSEEFIEKHFDKLHRDAISIFQKLSEEFIRKHAKKLNIHWILGGNESVSEEFKQEIRTLKEII